MSTPVLLAPETRVVESVEVRAETERGEQVLTGTLVPYGKPANVNGLFLETIAAGAFSKSIREAARRLPLMARHDLDDWPIGSADSWDDDDEALRGVWTLADTEQAREVYKLVRDGHLSAMSVGFQPIRSDWRFTDEPGELDQVVRREARLLEASVVPVGVYADARVLVRSAEGRRPGRATPRLDAWREWVDQARAGAARLTL